MLPHASLLRSIVLPMLFTAVAAQPQTPATTGWPPPSGAHTVGTVVVDLTDSARIDAEFSAGRPIRVQFWYPAKRVPEPSALAPYLVEPQLLRVLLDGYYGQTRETLLNWADLRTHAVTGAPASAGRYPLITLSVGLGNLRANYTSLAEEIASHGFLVAAVESPFAGVMALADGRTVQIRSDLEDAKVHRQAVSEWVRDIGFVIDVLKKNGPPAGLGVVSRIVDWDRLGAIGHSTGGLVAVQACESDARFKACVNMDGGLVTPSGDALANFVTEGTKKPTLFLRSQPIYSDADLAKRGLTRAQWEARGAAGRVALEGLLRARRATTDLSET